jgi:hypothetical protein
MQAAFRAVVRLAIVFVVTAIGLRVLDAVPRAVTGLPRGVVRVASVKALAQLSSLDVPLPVYFPAHLRWPPNECTWDGRIAAVTARHVDSKVAWLSIALAPESAGVAPASILPAVEVLQDSDATIAGVSARVQRVQDRDGAIWHQAEWTADGRRFAVRYRGSVEDLLRIAGSLRTGNRP